ncbi:hypothetical protein BIW11_03964 [Tropilaelaps mercedesae]|uniref:Uncharacterized protein n=1 Tax=Tropilaelaps mercedesae TaxID=418985 RepID=A0A1V9XDC6_9ACAR|nr:hypothetical protein BIW11_03964 [Tropilaelaps mercedesae]
MAIFYEQESAFFGASVDTILNSPRSSKMAAPIYQHLADSKQLIETDPVARQAAQENARKRQIDNR